MKVISMLTVILVVFTGLPFLSQYIYHSRLKTYTNKKAHFSIQYPSDWSNNLNSIHSEFQEGIVLYERKPDVKIGIYASTIPWSFSVQDTKIRRGTVLLRNGVQAQTYLIKADSNIKYIAVIETHKRYYIFYSHTPQNYYERNHNILDNIVKSIQTY